MAKVMVCLESLRSECGLSLIGEQKTTTLSFSEKLAMF